MVIFKSGPAWGILLSLSLLFGSQALYAKNDTFQDESRTPETPAASPDANPTFDEAFRNLTQIFNRENTLLPALQITKDILRLYPPETYHYIFVGRSLTLLRSLLDAQGVTNTGLPLRGKNFDPTQTDMEKLQTHLTRHLPSEIELKNKELVLLDFSVSGEGLNAAQKALDWYYQGRKILNLLEVSEYYLSLKHYLPSLPGRSKKRALWISPESMLFQHLYHSNFDSYAGYGSFNLQGLKMIEGSPDTQKNYIQLTHWLQQTLTLSSSQALKLNCSLYLY